MPDWKKIKAEYIRGDTSYRKLAAKHGVSFSTLRKIAAKEKWTDLRNRAGAIRDTKIVESVASREAAKADKFDTIADALLDMIASGIADGSIIAVTGRGYRDITGALKDLREIKNIRSELDVEEQKARIEKLKRDCAEEDRDTTIKVIIDDDLGELSG